MENSEEMEKQSVDQEAFESYEKEELENHEDEEAYKADGGSWFWLFLDVIIFGYNTYAITSNLCAGYGYLMIAIGLAVNIWILFTFSSIFEAVIPWVNKNFSYLILIAALAFGIYVGYFPPNQSIEDISADLVNSIIKEDLKMTTVKCESVELEEEISPDVYRGKALLNNGKTVEIRVNSKDNMIRVHLDTSQLIDEEIPKTEDKISKLEDFMKPPSKE